MHPFATKLVVLLFALGVLVSTRGGALAEGTELARESLVGTWNGGDWGSVNIDAGGAVGSYERTYNGQPGTLQINSSTSELWAFAGTFSETSATEGQPLRQGHILLKVTAVDGQGRPSALTVTWESTDGNNGRPKSGSGSWTRFLPVEE